MPRRRKVALELPDDFTAALEKGVRTVLGDTNSTNAERVQALNAGMKLLLVRHKVETKDDTGDFFPNSTES